MNLQTGLHPPITNSPDCGIGGVGFDGVRVVVVVGGGVSVGGVQARPPAQARLPDL